MAQNGKILEKDIIDKGSYEIGEKFAKSLQPAIDEIDKFRKIWIDSLKEIKQSAIDFHNAESKYKSVDGMKDFIAAKKLQTEAAEKYAKATKEEAAAVLLLQRAEKEKVKTEKELIALEEKQISLSNKKEVAKNRIIELTAKERYEISVLNKQNRELAVISSKLSTEYEKQSVKLEILRRKYKDVALTQGESSREARKLEKEVRDLDATLKRVDANVGQFQRNVGNYGSAMKSAAGAARELMGALGLTSGITLFVGVMYDAFQRVREFDKEMQTLAGVLQTNRKELKSLEESIIDFSTETTSSARELAKLTVELARLGKTEPEIKKLFRPVSNLALALEATSEEAGTFLIQMLNAFGDGASEADKYANTIASISNTTSLDFEKMKDSLQYIAPISRILNKDLAYTGAVVGILADNSLKAESAGRLLASAQMRLSKQGLSLNEALEKINEAQRNGIKEVDLLKLANNLFGIDAGRVGIILANNTDIIEKNSQAIRDNASALDDLVKEQLESLDSKIKILDNSWEQLILTIESGQGPAGEFFGDVIDWLSETIQKFTEFEAAAAKVKDVLGRGQTGWERFNYEDDYDKAIDQMVAIMQNAELTEQSLNQLTSTYNDLNKKISQKNTFSKEEIAVFKNQAGIYKEAIQAHKTNRKALEDEALTLGFAEKAMVLFTDKISDYTNHELQEFINQNKKSTEATEESTEAINKSKAELAAEAKALREANKAKREQERAARDAAKAEEELNKALEARIRLIQKTTYENRKAKLESQIDSQNDVAEDESQPVSVRLSSNQNSYELSVKKAEEARDRKKQILSQEYADKQASDLKLVQTEAQRCEVIEQLNEAHFQELEKIETEFNDEIRQAEENRSKTSIDIVKDEFEKRLAEIKAAQESEKNLRNEELGAAQSTFKSSAQSPEDVEKYRNAVEQINNKYDLKEIQAAKDKAQYILDNYVLSEEARLELQKFISDESIKYSNEETEQILENIEAQKEAFSKFVQLKQNLISFMSEGLAESLGADQRDIQDFFSNIADFAADIFTDLDTIPDDFAGKMQAVLGTLSAAAGVTRDIMAGIFAANIDDLERQREASNDYYDNQIEAAEGNEALQTQLREKQKKEDEEYQKKIKKEKTDAAKADKAAAIIQAQINTALAITAALNTQPFLPLGPIMAILAGAMGTAQTIAIAAKPIPKFKTGVENFGGGLAVLGDGGVSEIVRTPDGKLHKTPNKDTLYDLPKGTNVYKSEDEYRKLMRASILTSIEMNANNAKKFNAENSFDRNYGKVNEKAIENAISNGFKNQKVNFHTTNHNHAKVDLNYTYWAMKQLKRE